MRLDPRGLDPRDLAVGDKVVFDRYYIRTVTRIDYDSMGIHFDNGDVIKIYSHFWGSADLVRPNLPPLNIAYADDRGNYIIPEGVLTYSAERILKLLKQDVALLGAAGVKEEV
jgi:hypothetical protein